MYYILKDKKPEEIANIYDWGKWMESGDRIVEQTKITNDINVSTVFLGLDHAYMGGTPILFETMIFGGENDEYQERYTTWDEAEKGHAVAVKLCNVK